MVTTSYKVRKMRVYFPANEFEGCRLWGSTSFRAHYPQVTEMLEELYDRNAENCELFVNISEVDKYSVTCTVCCHFSDTGCGSPAAKVPDLLKLLESARLHDGLH